MNPTSSRTFVRTSFFTLVTLAASAFGCTVEPEPGEDCAIPGIYETTSTIERSSCPGVDEGAVERSSVTLEATDDGAFAFVFPTVAGGCPAEVRGCELASTCELTASTEGGVARLGYQIAVRSDARAFEGSGILSLPTLFDAEGNVTQEPCQVVQRIVGVRR